MLLLWNIIIVIDYWCCIYIHMKTTIIIDDDHDGHADHDFHCYHHYHHHHANRHIIGTQTNRFVLCKVVNRDIMQLYYLVGGLVAMNFIFPYIKGMSSSQLTNSYLSEGWPKHQPVLRLTYCAFEMCLIMFDIVLFTTADDILTDEDDEDQLTNNS